MNLSPLLVSLKISCCSIVFTFFLGILVAYKMYFYKGKFKIFFDGFINITLVLPPTVTGFVLLVILGKHGFIGSPLSKAGISLIFTWQAAAIASFFITFPLMYRSVISSFALIDTSLFEAAESMGASKFQVLRCIAVPLTLPGIVSGVILAFLRSFGEFGATLMVAGNIPNKTQTVTTSIFFLAMNGDMKAASYWVAFLIVFSFIFMVLVSVVSKSHY